MKFVKTKTAQPQGQYVETGLDVLKSAVDFRLVDVSGPRNVIIWSNGDQERVTDGKLAKLQQKYNWATDF